MSYVEEPTKGCPALHVGAARLLAEAAFAYMKLAPERHKAACCQVAKRSFLPRAWKTSTWQLELCPRHRPLAKCRVLSHAHETDSKLSCGCRWQNELLFLVGQGVAHTVAVFR